MNYCPQIQTERNPKREASLPSGGACAHQSLESKAQISHPLLLAFGDERHTFRTEAEAGGASGLTPPPILTSQVL